MTNEIKQVMEKLDVIKSELNYIKKHMVDADTVLTFEEEQRLEESLKDFKEGRTISLEDFEKEMKNAKNRAR
ncbi:MAG: hypothetical protein AABX61_00905 [Nanoarchaeota archaeon]